VNISTDVISSSIKEMQRTGHIQLDSEAFVVGAVGLSLIPTTHEISIDGRKFWAWCAFDVIGIFAALHASGFVQSLDPSCHEKLRLEFVKGVPQDRALTVFMADLPSGSSICGNWCSKVNFFTSVQSAHAWIQMNQAKGSLISVENLLPVAQEVWSGFLPA
jgi:hypothetical protein